MTKTPAAANWSAVMRFARSLWHCGVDMHYANEAFPLNGKVMPARTSRVLLDVTQIDPRPGSGTSGRVWANYTYVPGQVPDAFDLDQGDPTFFQTKVYGPNDLDD